MTIAEMHWELEFRYNKMNSNNQMSFSPLEKDAVFNNVIPKFVELIYKGSPEKSIIKGFEINQQATDILSPLVINDEIVTVSNNAIDLANLTHNYYHFLDLLVETDCGNFIMKVVQTDDLNMLLKDSFVMPSKQWRRGLITFHNNLIKLHLPSNVNVTNVKLSYLRQPVKVYYGNYNTSLFSYAGYDSVNFTVNNVGYQAGDPPVDCDLPEIYHTVIVDYAVEHIAKMLYDGNQVQAMQDNITQII